MKLNIRRKIGSADSVLYKYAISSFLISFFTILIISIVLGEYGLVNEGIYKSIIRFPFIIFPIILFYYSYKYIAINRQLNNRDKQLAYYALSNKMKISNTLNLSSTMLALSEGKRDIRFRNCYVGDDWAFCDFEFSKYQKKKYGEYKSETYYFSIGAFQLPRKLPNVMFDSHSTGGREFDLLFDSRQRHSLEGDFDKYFTTYFHQDYTIDSLSFITPEVMQALIVARDYDVEISGDILYLYNEIENMPDQLHDFEAKGDQIRKVLLNNILTYRDDRIKYSDGRRTVSFLGLKLRRSLKLQLFNIFLGTTLCLLGMYILFWARNEVNTIPAVSFYLLCFGLVLIILNIRKLAR